MNMKRRHFVFAAILLAAWLGNAGRLRSNDAERSENAPARPIPPASAAPADPKAERDLVEVRMWLVELRGDAKRALKEAGFSALGRAEGKRLDTELIEFGPGRLELLKQNADSLDVLSAPTIRMVVGQTSSIEVSSGDLQLPYFVRTGEKTFALTYSTADTRLGIRIQLGVRPVRGQDDKLSVSPIKISMTTLDGREPVDGVDLDIGKPIFSTRTLETSMTVVNGAEPSGIVLPAPAGRQPVLFFSVQRVREPRPGEVVPHPGAMIPIPTKPPKGTP
jgi:hypothetical protein